VHLALEETSPPFSNDVNMLDVVPTEPVRDLHNEAGKAFATVALQTKLHSPIFRSVDVKSHRRVDFQRSL
jgi:hypothetical protein